MIFFPENTTENK